MSALYAGIDPLDSAAIDARHDATCPFCYARPHCVTAVCYGRPERVCETCAAELGEWPELPLLTVQIAPLDGVLAGLDELIGRAG